MRQRIQLVCAEGCGHSRVQHEAFDAGFLAGTRGADEVVADEFNDTDEHRDSFLTGYSAGIIVHNYGLPRGKAAVDAILNEPDESHEQTWRIVTSDE